MFLDLFDGLRAEGVAVAIQEWQGFLRALEEGVHGCSLLRFYHLGRARLIKSETYFDAYDRVFARVSSFNCRHFGLALLHGRLSHRARRARNS
jgi:uncharacterized protein with von Willebrand factor type A (vWA) domain